MNGLIKEDRCMMQTLPTQLTLGISLKDEATFDNFYEGRNGEVISALKKMARGPEEKFIYLCGAQGQGSSHLLKAACHEADQHKRRSFYLPLAYSCSLSHEILQGLEAFSLICLDDFHVLSAHPEWEEAIFHLYNRVEETRGSLLIAARDLPKSIALTLPDLISRLSFGITYQIHPLRDEEKCTVLMMRANRRGMSLSEEVGKYIMTHCPRHMGALFSVLDLLDKVSLAAQRRLTIPFVKEVLQIEDLK